MEVPDFDLGALREHSHASWDKSKGLVSISYSLASAEFLLEQLCFEAFGYTQESGCGVLLSLQADALSLLESQVSLCASIWCGRPGPCLCCFSLSY